MLVSHRHKFIFIKPPKTGGSSVESVLRNWCLEDPDQASIAHRFPETISQSGIITEGGNSSPVTEGLRPHSTVAQIRDLIGFEKFSQYTKITIVRNPFDRAVSLFWWDLKKKSPTKYDQLSSNHEKLAQQFESWLIERLGFVKWANSNRFASLRQLGPRRFILRYETLEMDFQLLLRLLNFSEEGEWILPKYKSNVRPRTLRLEEYYTAKSRALIAWYWRADLIHHRYSWRLPAEKNL